MPNHFVIFARARTGSNALVGRLDSCPDVTCHGEIFKQKRIDIAANYRRRLPIALVRERNARPLDFIAGIRALDPQDHVGFKIFPPHLDSAPGVVAFIAAQAIRRIVLTRAPLEVYASFLRMRATGVHKLKEGETPRPEELEARVRFSRPSFQKFLTGYNRFSATGRLIAAIPSSFVIDYAQVNDPAVLDALFSFVGSSARGANSATAFRKQFAGSLETGFENWGELQDFLKTEPILFAGPPPTVPLG